MIKFITRMYYDFLLMIRPEIVMQSLERDFLASWDNTENYYSSFYLRQDDRFKEILALHTLILKLRRRGYDKLLRAGSPNFGTQYMFVVSRARKHILKSHHSSVWIIPTRRGKMGIYLNVTGSQQTKYVYNNVPDYIFEKIELNHTLVDLLNKLVARPIDR